MNKRNRGLAAILAVFLAILVSVNLISPGLIATTGDPEEEKGQLTTVEQSIEDIPGAEVNAETAIEAVQQPDAQGSTGEMSDTEAGAVEEKSTEAEEADKVEEQAAETKDEEAVVQTLDYEDDDIAINVREVTVGAIPEEVSLKIVPLLRDDEKTGEQYKETEAKLQEKAETEEYDIAGFLAYDITFVDVDGNKVEPNGEVKVTMDYKQAAAPEEVQDIAPETDVTVMHLEEDEHGTIKKVVDMNESQQVKVLDTTNNKEVKKAEFETNSFSVYTLTWKYGRNNNSSRTVKFYYVDTNGNEIPGKSGSDSSNLRNTTLDLSLPAYQTSIPGYEHSYTTINNYNNSARVRSIKGQGSNMYYTSTNGTESSWSGNNNMYDVYFVYESYRDPGIVGPGTQELLGEPDHHKTIKRNGTDEEGVDGYTISLDVTGRRIDPTPIDILLIIDFSGSMEGNRISNVKEAIQALKTQLEDVNNQTDIRFAAVEFSGPGTGKNNDSDSQNSRLRNNVRGDATTTQNWVSYDNFDVDQVMSQTCTGGTNWQAGIRQGNKVMASARPNADQYVIFLTDGSPTFRYGTGSTDVNGDKTIDIKPNNTSTTYGTGNTDPNGYNLAAAKAEYTESLKLQNTKARYLVNADSSENNCATFAKHIGATGADGNVGYLSGANASQLDASFKAIADSIGTMQAYTDVTIEDKISEYVKFAVENPSAADVRVYAKAADNSNETQLNAMQYTVDTAKLTRGIVSVKLLKGFSLEDGTTYRVEFDVIPSEKAITGLYEGVTYSGTGDAETDHSSNNPKFSEGKSGYWSNANNNTKLIYTDTGKPSEKPYQKPVFQVQTIKYSVEKVWKGPTDTDLESMKVDVKLTAKAVTDKDTVDLVGTVYLKESKVTLDKTRSWKHTWENLPKYYYYYDNAGKAKHVKIQYGVKELDSSGAAINESGRLTVNKRDYIVTYAESDGKTVITNTGVLNTLSILKVDSADTKVKLQGAEFKLEKKNTNGAWESVEKSGESDYVVTTLESGMAFFEGLGNGTYRIVEIKAPVGYTILEQPFEITLPYVQSNPADENISVDGNHKVTVTIKNNKTYVLPSAGGMGTYLFTISGVSILMTALLLFIMNKRKERGGAQKI